MRFDIAQDVHTDGVRVRRFTVYVRHGVVSTVSEKERHDGRLEPEEQNVA